jgi:hypothetical protein
MSKLSDTQLVILSAACQRPDRSVYPLATKLPGAAATKVLTSLLGKCLIEEIEAKRDDIVWREDEQRGRLTLRASDTAFAALGIEPETTPHSGDTGATGRDEPDSAAIPATDNETAPPAPDSPRPRKTREGTKQAQLIDMLRRPEGATIAEIVTATGWQAHTVRGAMAGALKKKLGLEFTSEKVEERGRVYRIQD